MKTVAIAFLAAALAMPAMAQDQQPQQEQNAGKPKKPRKICKSEDNATSRITRNVCKTAEEWAAQEADAQHDRLDALGRSPGAGAGLPGRP